MGREGAVRASFRDPSGFLFRGADGVLYRQINAGYEPEYRRLMESRLYADLTGAGLLVEHEEVWRREEEDGSRAAPTHAENAEKGAAEGGSRTAPTGATKDARVVIRPREVPFISYPYEWSFGQMKDAALLTLDIAQRAVGFGMTLKDCSAYNVQFVGSRAVFIDTLSFETYREGEAWVAYRQFCQHFLAPLALMAKRDVRLGQLLRVHIDGVPLDLASELLPWRTRLKPGLLMHIHAHAKAQRRYSDTSEATTKPKGRVSKMQFLGLIDSLRSNVSALTWKPAGTEWADYYTDNSYSAAGLKEKEERVAAYIEQVRPKTAWDLGANTGRFSRLASERGAMTVAWDIDPACVELCYRDAVKERRANLLPLVLDLTNPSPGLGWAHEERDSLAARGPADLVMALALVHHLAIANNVPLGRVAEFFRRIGRSAIVEFVPKDDPQVKRLLASRDDIFPDYTRAGFEAAFGREFEILVSHGVKDSGRTLYLMKART